MAFTEKDMQAQEEQLSALKDELSRLNQKFDAQLKGMGLTEDDLKQQEAMTPGDLVTYDCATATVRREQVDVRQYRAWIDGVIRYDAITLPSLLRRLAREYDVEIDLRTRRFDDTTFRISLSSAQNIKSVMRALCDILPISVSCEGCRYVVDALPQ